MISYRRKIEWPDSTDLEWHDLMMSELEKLNNKYDDPEDTTCKHCIIISIGERLKEIKELYDIEL